MLSGSRQFSLQNRASVLPLLIKNLNRLSINLFIVKNWVSLIACSVGFVSCKTFGKQPKHPCFGAKPPTGSRGGSPSNIAPARMPGVYAQRLCTMQSQPSIHSLSRGKGVFGKDAEIRTHQALSMDAYKWSNKVGMQGCIKSVTLNRCTMQRHKRLTRQ